MGYTHHYQQNRSFTTKEWNDLVDTIHLIIFNAKEDGVVIKGGTGENSQEITKDYIGLNGDGSQGLNYEPFIISKRIVNRKLSFCKTNKFPYDGVVVSILNYINQTFNGVLDIDSDGGVDAIVASPYWKPEGQVSK